MALIIPLRAAIGLPCFGASGVIPFMPVTVELSPGIASILELEREHEVSYLDSKPTAITRHRFPRGRYL